MARIGQQFGDYCLIDSIANGGTAKVYLGQHVHDPCHKVAIKILKMGIDDPAIERIFLHEVKILTQLQHPNIIRIIAYGVQDTEPYIIMERAQGGDLGQIPQQSLTPKKICAYARQIANALHYAHQHHKIVHSDLKPQNVFVGQDGTLMVGDFGYARVLESTQQHSSTPQGWTWAYTAPEQIDQERFGKPSPASDQYALGIMVYQWFSGSLPFDGTTPPVLMHQHMNKTPSSLCKRVPDLSSKVQKVVFKALAKQPSERHQDIVTFAAELEKALSPAIAPAKRSKLSLQWWSAMVVLFGLTVWLISVMLTTNPNIYMVLFILLIIFLLVFYTISYTPARSNKIEAMIKQALTSPSRSGARFKRLDTTMQCDIAERLLAFYESAQKERRFADCAAIEQVIINWLLALQAEEKYPQLPYTLHDAICNTQQPKRQRAVLTLLAAISGQLRSAPYNICPLLISSLLALCGLDAIGEYQPATQLSVSQDLDVADLALIVLSFMGQRGPAGLLLQELRQYFKQYPQQLGDLARYSLECGTLITPTFVPVAEENYQQYEAAISRWIQLRGSYKRTQITPQNIKLCIDIHQTLLDCAEEAKYPMALHICTMLQQASEQATGAPKPWQEIWQNYMKKQLDTGGYVSYQQAALLWTMLFLEERDLQPLADHVLTDYHSSQTPNERYSQRFLSLLSFDWRDLRYLIGLRDWRDWRDLRYLRYLRYLIGLRDLRDLRDWRDLRYLRYLLLTKDVTEPACIALSSQGCAPDIDLLTILMGRLLQLQENDETGPVVEAEVHMLANAALRCLTIGSIDAEIRESALDVIRYLPMRTESEVQFVWQVVSRATERNIYDACAYALGRARPKDNKAWEALSQGQTSQVKEIRQAVASVLQRRK